MRIIDLGGSLLVFHSTPASGYVVELEHSGRGRWRVRGAWGRPLVSVGIRVRGMRNFWIGIVRIRALPGRDQRRFQIAASPAP
jgi:hypothetical protein